MRVALALCVGALRAVSLQFPSLAHLRDIARLGEKALGLVVGEPLR
jgi:hypothetical protein